MNRTRHIVAALLAIILLTGFPLNASAWAGMSDPSAMSMADAVMLDGGCDSCDEAMDDSICEAVCTGMIAVLPIEMKRVAATRSMSRAAPVRRLQGRTVQPQTSPPDLILG